MMLRSVLRRIYYAFGRIGARLQNGNVRFGRDCSVALSAKFFAGGRITIGDRCQIHHGVLLMPNSGGIIELGDDCSIHAYSVVSGVGGVHIGNKVRIAAQCTMMSFNHCFDRVDVPIMKQASEFKPITVDDDVWIGARVTILAGVHIGTGAVIGAGAVVTRDIPSMAVAVGVPARVISIRGQGSEVKTNAGPPGQGDPSC
jgi:acetyltransferase-like isoleucine patch superfamily enzyme